MSLSTVELNYARLSISTESSFSDMLREAAELKLYYLRDILDPTEFDELVQQEIHRSTIQDNQVNQDANIKDFVRFVKSRICKRIWSLKRY